MNKELECEIIKDLLPLYVDRMVSDVTKERIEGHLQYCKECTEMYQNMDFNLEEEKQSSEVQDVKKFLKKTKKMYFLYGLGGLSFIALIICMIVDLSINKGVTWSLIVASSILFTNALMYTILVCTKNKAYMTMSVVSIGTVVLLFIIQISKYYLMNIGTLWIFRYGFPIMLLWLGGIWIPIICKCTFKWQVWDCIAVFMIMVIIGNYVTKLITGDYVVNDLWSMHNFIGNGLGETIGAVLFGAFGRFKKWKK